MANAESANQNERKAEQFAELGNMLSELRVAQGYTLDDASSETKIQKKFLAAIEEGRLEAIPKGPYCRGFLRQYCEFLNAGDIWLRYDKATRQNGVPGAQGGVREEDASYFRAHKSIRPKSRAWLALLVISSLSVAAWLTWQYRGDLGTEATTPLEGGTSSLVKTSEDISQPEANGADKEKTAAPRSVDLGWMDGEAPQERVLPAAQTAPEAPPVVRVSAKSVIWVKFSIGQKTLFQGLLKQGESREYSPTEAEPLRVRYGNPVKSSVLWGGEERIIGSNSDPITRYYWYDGRVTETR